MKGSADAGHIYPSDGVSRCVLADRDLGPGPVKVVRFSASRRRRRLAAGWALISD